MCTSPLSIFFFFNAPATTEIYTLSLHDALPILAHPVQQTESAIEATAIASGLAKPGSKLLYSPSKADRKSTRLNSSHLGISYAVFCLKKKKKKTNYEKKK